jgi:DNA topoisomerase III
MRLIIAEKPSLARAIAAVLPGPQRPRASSIECAGGADVVAWCVGHILEQAAPEAYDERLKTWRLEDLPIAPSTWKLVPKEKDLLANLQQLLRRADRVVHAGDPDREGQLLVDEVLVHLGYRGPVDRLLISDQNPEAVAHALRALRPNADFRGLSEAALARQRADWLYGMNLTRLYTLLGRGGGHDGVLSVGRVQTPVLGLVVRRDLEIEGFKPKPYFVLQASITTSAGTFLATWKPGPSAEQFLDPEGRLTHSDKAAQLAVALTGAQGRISRATTERKSESPPLPYSLPDLQVDAAKLLGFSVKDTLDLAQALYETHRLTTYPRSDCPYLPEGHLGQAATVLAAIEGTAPGLAELVRRADRGLRSRAWNDSKVTAHHAIIPTGSSVASGRLSEEELALYGLISRRYIAQFYPPYVYNAAAIEADIAGEAFVATGRQLVSEGWRATLLRPPAKKVDDGGDDEPAGESGTLPAGVKDGDPATATEVKALARKTRSPKRFDDASLMEAMIGISRFVDDPNVKRVLRETDGIGTPATQANIVETLFKRGFLEKRKRQIISTATGRLLIASLPALATTPDMTAVWELAIRRIADRQVSLDDFLRRVLKQVQQLIEAGRKAGALRAAGATPCPQQGCTGILRERKGKRGPFFACTRWPECSCTMSAKPASAR